VIIKRPVFAATLWDLTEAFFQAQADYRELYLLYETQVLAHAEEQSVDRRRLRLDATEVSKLVDFGRLQSLRSGALSRTKGVSHSLFRSKSRTHKFDRFVSEIFHELSILREEQFKVSTFAEEYRRENELGFYESILDEVHEDFPRRVHHIHELFKRAQRHLEGVLRAHRLDPVYLRSFYLFGDQLLRDAYPDGAHGHAWAVFDRGPAEAYFLAARSFARKGFKDDALAALARAEESRREDAEVGLLPEADGRSLADEIDAFRTYVDGVSPPQLVEELVHERVAVSHGDDAAPGLDEDFTSRDETSEVEELLY